MKKKFLIALLFIAVAFLVVRKIRLEQLLPECEALNVKSNLIMDTIDMRTYSHTRDFSGDTAMLSRAGTIVKQLKSVKKKIDFWNLKL